MSIDKAEVRRIARLAHLEYPQVKTGDAARSQEPLMDDETLERLAGDMSRILDYVKQLEEVDVSEVRPTSHGVDVATVFRDDAPREGASSEALLEGAPARSTDAVSVPKIVE